LAFELLLPPSSFSARCVCAFQFLTLEDFIRSARIIIYGHVKTRRRDISFSNAHLPEITPP